MSLAGFLTGPIPLTLAIAVTLGIGAFAVVSHDIRKESLKVAGKAAVLLIPLTYGLWQGPATISLLLDAGGVSSVTWRRVVDIVFFVVVTGILVGLTRQLGKTPGYQWVLVPILAYAIGTVGHVILLGSGAFVEWWSQ